MVNVHYKQLYEQQTIGQLTDQWSQWQCEWTGIAREAGSRSVCRPDDRLGGAEHELQHSDSWCQLPGCHIRQVADSPGCFHCHHVILVAQAALQEVVEAAGLSRLAGPRFLNDLSHIAYQQHLSQGGPAHMPACTD